MLQKAPQQSTASDDRICVILYKILCFAIPSSVGSVLNLAQQTINLAWIGSLNDPMALAAMGLGNMLTNIIILVPTLSLNNGLETLVAQARGQANERLCGIWLQRGRLLVLCAFVPFSLIMVLAI